MSWAGSEPSASTNTRGAGYSPAGSPSIQAISPTSQVCTVGNVSSVPTLSGTVKVIGNSPSSSAGSTPPVQRSTVRSPSGSAEAVNPATSPAVARGAGTRTATSVVGDPSSHASGRSSW